MNLAGIDALRSLWRWLTGSEGRRFLLWAAPWLLIILALALRLYGYNWDQGNFFHPDERSILMRADCMYRVLAETPGYEACTTGHYDPVFRETVPGIPNFGVFFDAARSPLNPHWFPIGGVMLYLLVAVRSAASPFTQMSLADMAVAGRTLSALADVGAVALVYLLGKRLYGRRVGLLAMVLITLAVFNIQRSHFYRPETFSVLLTLASFWFMLNVLQGRRWRDHLLLGLMVGLAFAVKVTSAPVLLPLGITYGYRLFADLRSRGGWSWAWGTGQRVGQEALAMAVVALATFFVLAPYTVIDFSSFVDHNLREMDIVREPGLVPYTVYYVGMPWFWYEVRQTAVWGLGLPLGLTAWGGLVHALAVNLRRPRIEEGLLLSWAILLFFSVTNFEVKFLRYIFPLMPVLILLGSRALFALLDWARRGGRRLGAGASALIACIVVATAFYALAFEGIYTRPHTAVQASAWINANVAPGTAILTDNHWDEGIPNLRRYQVTQLPMYDGDSRSKMLSLAADLATAEYLVSYSDRPYGSIARASERYPQSSRYYRLLFAGALGYELERSFTSYPQLLGVAFVDDTFTRPGLPEPGPLLPSTTAPLNLNLGHADQNLIDYDHPKVLLFRNTGRLTQGELFELLWVSPLVTDRTLELMLSPEEAAAQQAGGTWSELFQRDSFANRFPVLTWLLLVEGIALVTLPLALWLFKALPDRGYLLAKPLGILLVAYPTWLLASLRLLPFSKGSTLLMVAVLALVSLAVVWRRRDALLRVVREHWRLFALGEALFLLAFLVFLVLRMANPDLWHPFRGGEKPMDFAYLNAVIRSSYMPPYDPWFAGGYLNYYYFGQFIIAALIKASGIVPEVAYNLAIPLLFALTFSLAFSLVYNLAAALRRDAGGRSAFLLHPALAGLTAALFVAVLANLEGAAQLVYGTWKVVAQGGRFPSFDFWHSSRAVITLSPGDCGLATKECASITEFPFFTFLFADLHAHLIVIPFDLLALGLALALVLGPLRSVGWRTVVPLFLLLALALGSLRAINTWDYPTFLLVGAGALFLTEYGRTRRLSRGVVLRSGLGAILLFGLGYLLFLPYLLRYEVFNSGVHESQWQTPLYVYLAIHAVFIFLVGTFLLGHARRLLSAGSNAEALPRHLVQTMKAPRIALLYLAIVATPLAGAILLVALGYSTVAFLFLVLTVSVLLVTHYLTAYQPSAPHLLFGLLLVSAAIGLGIGVELVTVNEDIGRMNTVFKFYLQAWLLLALASAFLLGRISFLWRPVRGLRMVGKGVWIGGVVLLLAGSLVYPILGTRDRLADRFQILPLTLDGTAFMAVSTYGDEYGPIRLRWDQQAIEWLQDNLAGSPVILEATTPYYRWGSRVSIYTGLPTVLGWDWHQTQQRLGYRWAVEERKQDIRTIYTTTSAEEALQLLSKYGVGYIYLGPVERLYYPGVGLEKFSAMEGTSLELVYPQSPASNPEVRIYRVVQQQPAP